MLKGYNQFPCSEEAKKAFVIMTPRGLFRFKRVPMGYTNSATWFQHVICDEVLAGLVYKICLVYLDDILIFGKTPEEFFNRLKIVLSRCQVFGLKVNLVKSSLFLRQVVWCGRLFSEQGMQANPKMVKSILAAEMPTTARELQQFYHAMNWLRATIPNFAQIAAPLHDLLEEIYIKAGRRTAKALLKIQLENWSQIHIDAVKNLKEALLESSVKAYPKPDYDRHILMDASEDGWSLLITQTPPGEELVEIEEKSHEMLLCLSGRFKKNQYHWHITSKEAYPLYKAIREAGYLMHMTDKFLNVYTDHRNLLYIFNPGNFDFTVKRYTVERLMRWSLEFQSVRYVIHHISGEKNVLADFFSRKAIKHPVIIRKAKVATLQVIQPSEPWLLESREIFRAHRVQAFLDSDLWPSRDQLVHYQLLATSYHPPVTEEQIGFLRSEGRLIQMEDRIVIPAGALSLIARLIVIAHCAVGHKGNLATYTVLNTRFYFAEQKRERLNTNMFWFY